MVASSLLPRDLSSSFSFSFFFLRGMSCTGDQRCSSLQSLLQQIHLQSLTGLVGALLLCCLLLVSPSLARNEVNLEWDFNLECSNSPSSPFSLRSTFVTHIQGIRNKNEWECERLTTPNGRETTSCVPSQFVVEPLVLRRPLTRNDVSFSNHMYFFYSMKRYKPYHPTTI